jgi:hypothetical protein
MKSKMVKTGEKLPSSVRRGGCGIKKMVAKPTSAPQTGWPLTKNVLERLVENWCVSDHPVRSFQRWLRDIFLMSRPPLLTEEGNKNHNHV